MAASLIGYAGAFQLTFTTSPTLVLGAEKAYLMNQLRWERRGYRQV
ncbi:hypothetical protein [Thermococcus zilligii]|nr:hypothetical protein [Thermococcus zilligii]